MKLTHVFFVALLASCQTVQTSFGVMNASSGPIPPATQDITVSREGHATTLFDLLSAVAESSGVQVLFEAHVRTLLRGHWGFFDRSVTITADEAWTVTEHALVQLGFHLTALHMGETKVIAVHESSQYVAVHDSMKVNVEELDYLVVHPGFIFSLTLELPNTETRTMANHLRALGHNLQCTPFGESSVLLEGLGGVVEKVARQLLEADESNGRRVEAARKELEAKQASDSKGATDG